MEELGACKAIKKKRKEKEKIQFLNWLLEKKKPTYWVKEKNIDPKREKKILMQAKAFRKILP